MNEYIRVLSLLSLQVDAFSSQSESMHSLNNLCHKFDLSSYDASYLDLAIRLNASLASRDKRLVAAAFSCGIPTIGLSHISSL